MSYAREDKGAHAAALVRKTLADLESWLAKDGVPFPDMAAIVCAICHSLDRAAELHGPTAPAWVLEAVKAAAEDAVD